MSASSTNRRQFIKAATVAGIGVLAGCTGDSNQGNEAGAGGGGEEELIWTTTSQGSASYAGAQGLAATVNDNSDDVYMEAIASDGTAANVGLLDRGEAQVAYTQNHTVGLVGQEEEPFQDLSFELNQLLHFLDTDWLFVTPNEELTTVADIAADSRVSPTQKAAGTAPYLERALGHAVDDYERISIDYTEQAGPFQEGRLDVGAIPIINQTVEPSYIQQQKSVVDLHVIEWPEEVVSKLEDDPLIEVSRLDMTGFEDYARAPDEAVSLSLSYRWIVPNAISYDSIYETLSVLHEHREKLPEYHALMAFLEDPEYWVESTYEGVPYHPAAADFYDEIGVWKDEFTRGEE